MAATTLTAEALKTVGTLLVLVLLLSGGGGFASAMSSSGCTSVLVSLSPCLDYISSGNGSSSAAQAQAPTASCCAQLGKVASSDPRCLCAALNADPASLGLAVNRTRALGLPDACKVKTPPVTDCKKSGGAGDAAAPPPTAGEPTTTTTASGSTGSKGTTPPSNGAARAFGSTAGFILAAVLATAATI